MEAQILEKTVEAPEHWAKNKLIKKHKPEYVDVSLRKFEGVNLCQWNILIGSEWVGKGPLFSIINNDIKDFRHE